MISKKTINSILNSKAAAFSILGTSASILSLYGWAAEKFLDYAPAQIGLISFAIIGIIAIFAIYFLISAYVFFDKITQIQSDHVLNHKITHQLRNSISEMQDLEYATSKKIKKAESEAQFPDIAENDGLKRQDIFKKLSSRISDTVAKQLKNHFTSSQIDGNIRITIKLINPDGKENQKEWKTVTVAVDPETWNDQDRQIESQANELHRIGDNSDFEGIMLGKHNCFVCNDLQKLSSDQLYKNSSIDWHKRYNSTIVTPIKSKPDGHKDAVYYGFITADSLNPSKQEQFSSEINSPTLNIMAHAADALATWFIKNDNHVKVIERYTIERAGLLPPAKPIDQENKTEVAQ